MKNQKLFSVLILNIISIFCNSQDKFINFYTKDSFHNYVINSVELNNKYYFLVNRNVLDHNSSVIYKTETNGTILDSIYINKFYNDTSSIITDIEVLHNKIIIYGYRFKNNISPPSTFNNPYLLRYTINENLNIIDSFKSLVTDTITQIGYGQVRRINDKILYTTSVFEQPKLWTLINITDTNGNYLFSKDINSKSFIQHLISIENNNNYLVYTNGPRIYKLNQNLDTLSSFSLLNIEAYNSSSNSLSTFSDSSFYLGYQKSPQQLNSIDSLCICILDTTGNILKNKCISPELYFVSNFSISFNDYTFDTRYKDNIYIGSNRNFIPNMSTLSYFQIANLDSNLSIRWSKTFGGDFPYFIFSYYATSDGGCLIMGKRKLEELGKIIMEPIVFKISQAGAITSLTSFSKDLSSQIAVYPNPVKNKLNILSTIVFQNSKMYLYSVTGDLLNTTTLQNGNNTIDVSAFQTGIYFYTIVNTKGQKTNGKFMKE